MQCVSWVETCTGRNGGYSAVNLSLLSAEDQDLAAGLGSAYTRSWFSASSALARFMCRCLQTAVLAVYWIYFCPQFSLLVPFLVCFCNKNKFNDHICTPQQVWTTTPFFLACTQAKISWLYRHLWWFLFVLFRTV